ncbi:MAG: glutamine synthetase beta-grasp domain-containing protein [Planctomycetaceae bacterium]
MSAPAKLEYIWLDGYQPTQSLRSKTKIVKDFSGKLEDCPLWAFDGSSTEQAPGGSSDCLLKPVALFPDPDRTGNAWLVMTEVLNPDKSRHKSNGRGTIHDDDDDFWFVFEQEYTIWNPDTNKPIGFPVEGFPGPQGPCIIAQSERESRWSRDRRGALEQCLNAGINVEGINVEG